MSSFQVLGDTLKNIVKTIQPPLSPFHPPKFHRSRACSTAHLETGSVKPGSQVIFSKNTEKTHQPQPRRFHLCRSNENLQSSPFGYPGHTTCRLARKRKRTCPWSDEILSRLFMCLVTCKKTWSNRKRTVPNLYWNKVKTQLSKCGVFPWLPRNLSKTPCQRAIRN